MNPRKTLINILVALLLCTVTYLTVREMTRYKIVGKVVSNETDIAVDGRGYEEDNFITICRMDGKCVRYCNTDDWMIWKRNSDEIRNMLKHDQMVEITVNGFGNIVQVCDAPGQEKPKTEDSPTTNVVEEVKK